MTRVPRVNLPSSPLGPRLVHAGRVGPRRGGGSFLETLAQVSSAQKCRDGSLVESVFNQQGRQVKSTLLAPQAQGRDAREAELRPDQRASLGVGCCVWNLLSSLHATQHKPSTRGERYQRPEVRTGQTEAFFGVSFGAPSSPARAPASTSTQQHNHSQGRTGPPPHGETAAVVCFPISGVDAFTVPVASSFWCARS